ncbi:hypothetical protein [Jongsikchunia kroppenstedtii]|uniref:hypothetical protein n=1 Tax=Jongsikchunia kroppenstedtii TaxID=1121721 RepID=UPI0012DEAE47|nr:hypothetical protein [Jongsikchunia kroppenstedtii]
MTAARCTDDIDPIRAMSEAGVLYERYLDIASTNIAAVQEQPEFIAPRPAPMTLTFTS